MVQSLTPRATRSAKELWELYLEDESIEVSSSSDSSYRHGTYETVVVKEGDRFWQGFYTLSGDGENHGWRDGDASDFTEVFPHQVTVTEYR